MTAMVWRGAGRVYPTLVGDGCSLRVCGGAGGGGPDQVSLELPILAEMTATLL
jgi:hypothetical protein